jgi:hypothetical protein
MYPSPNPPAPLKLRGTGSSLQAHVPIPQPPSLLRKEGGYVFVVQLYIPLLAKQGGGLRGWVHVTKRIKSVPTCYMRYHEAGGSVN